MTEFVAPYSKNHLFIVMHQYNNEDKNVLCRAQVIKDSAFFDTSTNSYIAAESFRLSLFGNAESGYCYQFLEPEWFCAADIDEPDEKIDEATIDAPEISTGMCIRSFNYANGDDRHELTMMVNDVHDDGSGTRVSSTNLHLDKLTTTLAEAFNKYAITQGSVLQHEHQTNKLIVQLEEDPVAKLVGPGFGEHQLGTCRVSLTFQHPDATNVEAAQEYSFVNDITVDGETVHEFRQINVRVEKSSLPKGFTVDDFGEFMSSGVTLFGEDDGKYALMDVVGPYRYERLDSVDWSQHELSGPDDVGFEVSENEIVPKVRFTTNRGTHYTMGGEEEKDGMMTPCVFRQWDDDELQKKETTCRLLTPPTWLGASHDHFSASVTVRAVKLDPIGYQKFVEKIMHDVHWGDNAYYIYKSHEPPCVALTTTCKVKLLKKYKLDGGYNLDEYQGDEKFEAVTNIDSPQGPPIHLKTEARLSKRVEGRIHTSEAKGVFTVNEMYEIFNNPDGNNGYWEMNTHANGGFSVQLLKKMDRFLIAEDLALAIGLEQFLVYSEELPVDGGSETSVSWVFLHCTDNGKQPLLGAGGFDDACYEGRLDEFFLRDPYSGERTELQPDTAKGQLVYRKEDTQRFKVLMKKEVSNRCARTKRSRQEPSIRIDNGNRIWCFENPPFPSEIPNDSRVSIQSFSLFEGVQVTIPDVPFQGQVVSYASGGERALLELRFPIEYGTGNNSVGSVVSTQNECVGDLIWNVGSNHQWLPLTASGTKIYQLTAEVSLVYRDAANRSPLKVKLSPGGIFQLKCVLLETK